MSFKLLAEVDRLDCLLRDIKRLQASYMKAGDLGNGIPSLEDCRLTARRVPCLQGVVFGHPVPLDSKTMFSSEIYAYVEEDGQLYARTQNRWYRLDVSRTRRQGA
jgi:hypothetical protein